MQLRFQLNLERRCIMVLVAIDEPVEKVTFFRAVSSAGLKI